MCACVEQEFEPITDAFFGELATLGFIGAIAFTLTYNFDSDCEGTCTVMQVGFFWMEYKDLVIVSTL